MNNDQELFDHEKIEERVRESEGAAPRPSLNPHDMEGVKREGKTAEVVEPSAGVEGDDESVRVDEVEDKGPVQKFLDNVKTPK